MFISAEVCEKRTRCCGGGAGGLAGEGLLLLGLLLGDLIVGGLVIVGMVVVTG